MPIEEPSLSPDGPSDDIRHGAMALGIKMHLIEKHGRRKLFARAQIQDGYSPMSQRGLGLLTKALVVRPMIGSRLNDNGKR